MGNNVIIGVMGGGSVESRHIASAYQLGRLIANKGWILLNGGRNRGIMEASAKGAMENGGMTVGILPDADDSQVSEYIQLPIVTGMGNARNCINILSSHFVVACKGGAGTLSEIALALKNNKPLILLDYNKDDLPGNDMDSPIVFHAETPEQAIEIICDLIKSERS